MGGNGATPALNASAKVLTRSCALGLDIGLDTGLGSGFLSSDIDTDNDC